MQGGERMHEMAIAESILDIALQTAKENGARRVGKIRLLLGEMAGVETESLRFCFAAVTQGTIAEGAELAIKAVPLVGRCTACGKEQHVERYAFLCPVCKSGALEILSGRELKVESLEVD